MGIIDIFVKESETMSKVSTEKNDLNIMTVTIAIACNDGFVIGADRKITRTASADESGVH